jgi:excisionase family DNA binding protein
MKLINTTEAAEALGVSVRRVRQLIAEGKLQAQNLGRDYAIDEGALKTVRVYGKPGRPPKVSAQPVTTEKRKVVTARRGNRSFTKKNSDR